MSAKKSKIECKKSISKRAKLQNHDIKWGEVMNTLEDMKKETDSKLEEISTICLNRECGSGK